MKCSISGPSSTASSVRRRTFRPTNGWTRDARAPDLSSSASNSGRFRSARSPRARSRKPSPISARCGTACRSSSTTRTSRSTTTPSSARSAPSSSAAGTTMAPSRAEGPRSPRSSTRSSRARRSVASCPTTAARPPLWISRWGRARSYEKPRDLALVSLARACDLSAVAPRAAYDSAEQLLGREPGRAPVFVRPQFRHRLRRQIGHQQLTARSPALGRGNRTDLRRKHYEDDCHFRLSKSA